MGREKRRGERERGGKRRIRNRGKNNRKSKEIQAYSELSLEICEDIGVGEIWEELITTSKLLCSTYLQIKGICSLKALKCKCLKYTRENTGIL